MGYIIATQSLSRGNIFYSGQNNYIGTLLHQSLQINHWVTNLSISTASPSALFLSTMVGTQWFICSNYFDPVSVFVSTGQLILILKAWNIFGCRIIYLCNYHTEQLYFSIIWRELRCLNSIVIAWFISIEHFGFRVPYFKPLSNPLDFLCYIIKSNGFRLNYHASLLPCKFNCLMGDILSYSAWSSDWIWATSSFQPDFGSFPCAQDTVLLSTILHLWL